MKMIILLGLMAPILAFSNCFKTVRVLEESSTIVWDFPRPRIEGERKETLIQISCDLYNKIQVGDALKYSETDKEIKKGSTPFLPSGAMTKTQYKILSK